MSWSRARIPKILTVESGSVMSKDLGFDEVLGRATKSLAERAQQHFGVTPDISTFGKALAGGMALAAVAGRKDVLELLRTNRVVNAGTL